MNQEQFIKSLQSTLIFIILVDTFFNTSYIYQLLSEVSSSFGQSLAYSLLLGGVFFAIAKLISHFGIRVIPYHSPTVYSVSFPIWLGFAIVVSCLSFWLTLLYLGLLPSQDVFLKRAVQKTNLVASSTIKAQREAEALEAVLLSVIHTADVKLKNEQDSGSVCGKGKGKGECANIISGLLAVSISTRNQIIESRASAAPLIRRIEDNQDALRRLAKNKELDFNQRVSAMKNEMSLMITDIEALKKVIPIPALQNAIEAFSREFKMSGIGDIGATRLKGDFRPVAEQLRRKIGYLKEISNREIKPIDDPSKLDILCAGMEAILPMAGIAFLMAFAPIGLIMCVLISIRMNRNQPPSGGHKKQDRRDNLSYLDNVREEL